MLSEKITSENIGKMKGHEKIVALTAYDYGMAQLLDRCDVPLLLVGDSLGMVVLGLPDTTGVTMEDMVHHTRAVSRAKTNALLVADLPYGSYESSADAVQNAKRLAATGAEAVKAEGGVAIYKQVRSIIQEGIPFLGHLGMLPQKVKEEGGYKLKGKNASEKKVLFEDAEALVDAGAFAVVLELVESETAGELTKKLPIPTIGIGSGNECDGQILVTTDLWSTSPNFIPKHVQSNLQVRVEMENSVKAWMDSLK